MRNAFRFLSTFMVLLMMLATEFPAASQNAVSVKGVIIDNQKQPVIGASVFEKGKSGNGSVTDIDGHFQISVPADAVLIFSSIGYKTIELQAKPDMTVVLEEDSMLLEDVVVVGYGTQKKESLTGAITAIKSDDIQTTKTESLISNIQGKMSGLLIRQKTGEPGTFDNMISIRGYDTPLIVIDGITREGTDEFAQLTSDDIESISILKDASASIYGMNSANGVIIVTTKRGRRQKPTVSYSGLVGMKEPTGMESTMDAYNYRLMANEMARNGQTALPYSDDIIEKYRTGAEGYKDWDWINLYMKKFAFQQNHDISVRGGSEKVQYFVSLGYNNDNGLLKSNIQWYKRYSIRANVNIELAKSLHLNIGVSGRMDNTQRAKEDFQWTFKTLMVNDRGVGPFTIGNNQHYSQIEPESKNPEALVHKDGNGYRQNRNLTYQTNLELKWDLPWVKGLSLSALGSFDGYSHNSSELSRSYQIYDYFTDESKGSKDTDQYTSTIWLNQKMYGRIQANYSHAFGKHNLAATAVAEMSETRWDYLMGSRKYSDLYTNDILDQASSGTASNAGNRSLKRLAAWLGRVNYDYAGKYLVEAVVRYDGSYRYAPGHRWAFFPSFSAGWRISEESFIKNNAKWISNIKLRASYGKSGYDAGDAFAYVYGYTQGNQSYTFDGSTLTSPMVAPGVVTDRLSWVKSEIINAGLDFGFLGGRIYGTVEVFQRYNDGILADRSINVPNTFGASFPKENINTTYNRGIEFEIGTKGMIGKDFSYGLSANYTYARFKYGHVEGEKYSSQYDRWQNCKSGRTMGGFWDHDRGLFMAKYDGQYQNISEYETAPLMGGSAGNSKLLPGSFRILDLNGDGKIDYNDQVPEFWGTGTNPPIQYGFNISLQYKNIDLNILLQGAAAFRIGYANDDIWGYGAKTNPTLMTKYYDRWHAADATADPYDPNTKWVSGKYPALRKSFDGTLDNGNSWGQGAISFWNPDATYLRVKSVELGYNLPKDICKKLGLSSGRIYVNGFNLFTFCNKLLKNADPEREERDWGANLAYPLMRTYNFGVNINF